MTTKPTNGLGMFQTLHTTWPETELVEKRLVEKRLVEKRLVEKREPKPGASRDSPPTMNPHHCPKCGTPGKYAGRQHQSEQFVLIAWKCVCGNTWGYTFPRNKLPDPETLL